VHRADRGWGVFSVATPTQRPCGTDVGLGWLAKQTPNVREAAAALERISGDAHRANEVLDSIRAIFKKEDQNPILLNANDVIKEVLALVRIDLEEHDVALRIALSDGAQRVLADRIQLQQVVLNLVRNAIEAMDGVTYASEVGRLVRIVGFGTDCPY
jgi:C4-dicarboxylate-specific signal transduction histidine kinase